MLVSSEALVVQDPHTDTLLEEHFTHPTVFCVNRPLWWSPSPQHSSISPSFDRPLLAVSPHASVSLTLCVIAPSLPLSLSLSLFPCRSVHSFLLCLHSSEGSSFHWNDG